MALTLDGSVIHTHASGGNITQSVTVNSQSNQILLVSVATHQSGGATGVTFGGAALTKVAEQVGSFGEVCQIWMLVNPTASTANVVTSGLGGGDFSALAVYRIYNAAQTTSVTTNQATGSNNTATLTINPPSANNWIIDCLESEPVPTASGSGQVQDWAEDGVPNSYDNANGSTIQQSGGPSAVSPTYSLSYGDRWNLCAVCIEPFGSTPPPAATDTGGTMQMMGI